MCDPISLAIIGSTVVSAGIADHQGSKQREQMRKQAEEAERQRKEQQAKFDAESAAARATPTLLRNATQKSGTKRLASLKVKKSGGMGTGYNSVGTGGSTSTGLNIPK